MKKDLLELIDRSIESAREGLKSDIIRLISVKSVKGTPEPGAPFGRGPRNMLDAVLKMGKAEGFETIDYNVGVVSLGLQAGQPDLGIWLHGDVVPEGAGWLWPPYEATEYEDCIIGRGATDNKGQLCAIFHLLKIFKDLDIPLNYNPALYVGSDEEFGMHDLKGIPGNEDAKGFCNVCTPPRLSLVPDSGFPVGYGGKGSMSITFQSKQPLHGLRILAGQSTAPGKATAFLYGKTIIAHSKTPSIMNPDPNGTMITRLMEKLLGDNLAAEEDRPILEFIKLASLDVYGEQFGINLKNSDIAKPVTVSAQKINDVNGHPELTVNIRYSLGITYDEIIEKMKCMASKYGFMIHEAQSKMEPYLLDKSDPVVCRLKEIANTITGEDKEPYTLNGYTYAHCLPHAMVYGMSGNRIPEGFPEGHGSAHGVDELVSLDRLQRGMRIYARALLELNDMDW